jgi:hypothetical protein
MHPTLKTLNAIEGRVGGYLVVWGGPQQRDLQGEYFTPDTDLGLSWYNRRPVLYHHGLDGDLKAAVIGVIDTLRIDSTGVWAEAQLDVRQRYVRAVQRLIDQGVLGWSSGSLPHLVEVADDGQIKRWPIVEGSLTPAPAEPRRTDVRTIKSAYETIGLDVAKLHLPANGSATTATATATKSHPEDDIETAMSLYRAHYGGNMDNEIITIPNEETSPRKRLPTGSERDALKSGSISVGSKFDSLDTLDLLHGYVMLRSAKSFRGVSEQYANALAHKIGKAGLSGMKANELSYSTQVGFGDEWVPDLWSAQIWHKARLENVILPLFQSIEMPSNPFELPIEGAQTPDGSIDGSFREINANERI